jgi:hypothetical protein
MFCNNLSMYAGTGLSSVPGGALWSNLSCLSYHYYCSSFGGRRSVCDGVVAPDMFRSMTDEVRAATSRVKEHATRHTSHVTRHASHVMHHISNTTRHTSSCLCRLTLALQVHKLGGTTPLLSPHFYHHFCVLNAYCSCRRLHDDGMGRGRVWRQRRPTCGVQSRAGSG